VLHQGGGQSVVYVINPTECVVDLASLFFGLADTFLSQLPGYRADGRVNFFLRH